MIVTVSQFNEYTGNFEDSESMMDLKSTILSASQELVTEYLRFDPEQRWGESVPDLVRLTVMRIATLMLMETGENIGVTGKSFADNSRSFISYTNYSKYLNPLQTFREVMF